MSPTQAGQWVVRFPNCHECQLGFQCPKKWEIGKQWPILEENFIAAATYWDKLTSYISHEAISATKKSPTVTVAQLEDQTCHPLNPHFGWRPFSTVGFVHKVIFYWREQLFQFVTGGILILSRKQLRLHHRVWFIALRFTSNQPRRLKFSVHVRF